MTARTLEERIEAAYRVVLAAQDVDRVRESHLDALVESTGLSIEGVRLAFDRHLELHPRQEELTELVTATPEADEVTVILSSNVFVAALRAIAIARAAAPRVIVRPSRREPHFPRLLVEALRSRGEQAVTLSPELDVSGVQRGELHVYGRDATIADVRARVRPGVVVRGHGSGMGVAWIGRDTDMSGAAEWLSDDVVAFDQRGCLSPRIAFVEGDDEAAGRFAAFAHDALNRAAGRVPRGPLTADEQEDVQRWMQVVAYAGELLDGRDHAVGTLPSSSPLHLGPSGRHLLVVACETPAAVAERLGALSRFVVNVGADEEERARSLAPPWARASKLGAMQRPPLDGPVDRRATTLA